MESCMTARVGIPAACVAVAIFSASVGPAPAQDAQTWPTRTIRLVVGAGAGGGTDIAARIVAQSLSEILGQPVVVENRPGAGGTAAADAVAKSPKDGYTAYMMSNSHAISAAMYKALRYDPLADFQMVSLVATAGLVLVTAPDFPSRACSPRCAPTPGSSISAAPASAPRSSSPVN
jgi:tripartite-type tricarboxylate transporter receptor subunit TctC